MKNFDLFVTFEDGKLSICTENGSGATYRVSNPKQVAFAMQEYITNYCMEEVDNEV